MAEQRRRREIGGRLIIFGSAAGDAKGQACGPTSIRTTRRRYPNRLRFLEAVGAVGQQREVEFEEEQGGCTEQ